MKGSSMPVYKMACDYSVTALQWAVLVVPVSKKLSKKRSKGLSCLWWLHGTIHECMSPHITSSVWTNTKLRKAAYRSGGTVFGTSSPHMPLSADGARVAYYSREDMPKNRLLLAAHLFNSFLIGIREGSCLVSSRSPRKTYSFYVGTVHGTQFVLAHSYIFLVLMILPVIRVYYRENLLLERKSDPP